MARGYRSQGSLGHFGSVYDVQAAAGHIRAVDRRAKAQIKHPGGVKLSKGLGGGASPLRTGEDFSEEEKAALLAKMNEKKR